MLCMRVDRVHRHYPIELGGNGELPLSENKEYQPAVDFSDLEEFCYR